MNTGLNGCSVRVWAIFAAVVSSTQFCCKASGDVKAPIITRYVSEGPAKLSLAHTSGWDTSICRSPNSTLAEPSEKAQSSIPAKTELFFDATSGGEYVLPADSGCKALVLIFFGCDCPISNAYSPELDRLHKKYSSQGIDFCVVYADADLTKDDARKHSKEYGFGFPAILDPKMSLALRVGAKIKPEAAILSPQGDLLYRGRIDDLYADFGKRRAAPTKRELRDALDSILAGKPIAVRRTEALGCDIDLPAATK